VGVLDYLQQTKTITESTWTKNGTSIMDLMEHHNTQSYPKTFFFSGKPKRRAGSAKPKVVKVLIVKRPNVFAAREGRP
jgi:thiol:disulfide interchange protein